MVLLLVLFGWVGLGWVLFGFVWLCLAQSLDVDYKKQKKNKN